MSGKKINQRINTKLVCIFRQFLCTGHCLVEYLLSRSSSVQKLTQSVSVVIVSEPSDPAFRADLTALV